MSRAKLAKAFRWIESIPIPGKVLPKDDCVTCERQLVCDKNDWADPWDAGDGDCWRPIGVLKVWGEVKANDTGRKAEVDS